jgi:hypothetical protein
MSTAPKAMPIYPGLIDKALGASGSRPSLGANLGRGSSGRAHQVFSTYDLWLSTPIQFRPLRHAAALMAVKRALTLVLQFFS